MDERRLLPRWQVNREAKVWLTQTQEFSQCIIEDINLKGMCASFNNRLPKEEPLNMSLALEDNSNPLRLEVNLPWVRETEGRYVYGMSFSKILDPDKDRIYEYINNHCSEQLKDKWWGA